MSYSRWSNSRWYTYWASDSLAHIKSDEYISDNDKKNLQVFEICEVIEDDFRFTYIELTENMGKCLKKVKEVTKCTDTEIEELKKYMTRFCRDIKEEYRGINA